MSYLAFFALFSLFRLFLAAPAPHPCTASASTGGGGETTYYVDPIRNRCYVYDIDRRPHASALEWCQDHFSPVDTLMWLPSFHSPESYLWVIENIFIHVPVEEVWIGLRDNGDYVYFWQDETPVDWILVAGPIAGSPIYEALDFRDNIPTHTHYREARATDTVFRWDDTGEGSDYATFCYHELTSCGPFQAYDTSNVCSGHGACYSLDVCTCDGGYTYPFTGSQTECVLECYGKPEDDPLACGVGSGNGTCVGSDNCVCTDPNRYGGKECNQVVCDGVVEGEPGACHDNGTCVEPDVCVCQQGYGDQFCSAFICDGILSTDGNVCSRNGSCDSPGICTCSDANRYSGQWCEVPVCYSVPQGNGGECNGEGTCVAYNDCDCDNDQAYRGPSCSDAVCYGLTEAEGACSGSSGTCSSPNNCACDPYHTGSQCETNQTCWGIHWADSENVCSGHGDCQWGSCVCDPVDEWGGPFCNASICNSLLSTDTENVCNGNGECIAPANCSCEAEWYGEWCDTPIECYDLVFDDPLVCRAHGQCVAENTCHCLAGYGGAMCTSMSCFNLGNDDDSVCSSSGICWAKDTCMCHQKYYGRECVEWIPNSVIIVSGNHSDTFRRFFVEYVVPVGKLGTGEEVGVAFNCTKRMFPDEHSVKVLGLSSTCSWSQDPSDSSRTDGLWIETDDPDCLLLTAERDQSRRASGDSGAGLNLELVLLTSNNFFERVHLALVLKLTSPVTVVDSGLAPETVVGIVVPLVLVLCCAAVVVIALLIGVGIFFRRVKKFQQLDDFDILLKEQQHAKDGSVAHFKMSTKAFEIDWGSITLEKVIGKGGSDATVFLAEFQGSEVAVKVFRASAFGQASFAEFEKEVSILSALSHPFILKFFGASIKESRVGIVMEYCSNGDLWCFLVAEQLNRSGSYPLREKLRMLREISSALAFVHGRSIVHRDIKPENVLITKAEETRLMDFGLSKVITSEASRANTQRIGTSFYMAPEVYLGENYSEACDIFSLSILIYVVLTEADDPYASEGASVESSVALNPAYRPVVEGIEVFTLCPWLVGLMCYGWAHDPMHRPSAADFVKAISDNLGDKEEPQWQDVGGKVVHAEEEVQEEVPELTVELYRSMKTEIQELQSQLMWSRQCLEQAYYYQSYQDPQALQMVAQQQSEGVEVGGVVTHQTHLE